MKYLIRILFLVILGLSACKKENTRKVSEHTKAQWIQNAFETLESGSYPRIKAIAWWHEDFDQSQLRIDSSPESLSMYRNAISSSLFISIPNFLNQKLVAPEEQIYHSAFPDFCGTEDIVTSKRIFDFENLVDKQIVWAYFSDNWYDKIQFPSTEVKTIHEAGKVPFIRIMPRSNFDEGGPDPKYTMQKIIDGDFDAELTQWAIEASGLDYPLLAEFGTEVNGDWFPWNGSYNGGSETQNYGDPNVPDGPERFRDAYRHIIDICRQNNATNITWFFHVDAYSEPNEEWNNIKNYYPGDNYIDWLGVSIYGPQEKGEDYQDFSEILGDVYPALTCLSTKPIAILEFAITEL